jgi:hypothetical protein
MAEIVLASCDDKYYELYGATFEKSLQNLNQPYHIHICEECPWDEVKKGSKIGVDKVWYACSRYLILPQMIEEHGGVFVSDIDAVFIKPIPFPIQRLDLSKPHLNYIVQNGNNEDNMFLQDSFTVLMLTLQHRFVIEYLNYQRDGLWIRLQYMM